MGFSSHWRSFIHGLHAPGVLRLDLLSCKADIDVLLLIRVNDEGITLELSTGILNAKSINPFSRSIEKLNSSGFSVVLIICVHVAVSNLESSSHPKLSTSRGYTLRQGGRTIASRQFSRAFFRGASSQFSARSQRPAGSHLQ